MLFWVASCCTHAEIVRGEQQLQRSLLTEKCKGGDGRESQHPGYIFCSKSVHERSGMKNNTKCKEER